MTRESLLGQPPPLPRTETEPRSSGPLSSLCGVCLFFSPLGLSKSLESISEFSILRNKPRTPPFKPDNPSVVSRRRFSDLPGPFPSAQPPEPRAPKQATRLPNPALPSWALPKLDCLAGAREKELRLLRAAPKGAMGSPPAPSGGQRPATDVEKKIKEVRRPTGQGQTQGQRH